MPLFPYTTIGELSTSVVQNTLEPWGTTPGTNNCTNDDASPPHCYVDKNFWGLCGPGAVANALQYWGKSINTYPAGTYTEPSYSVYHSTTYWTSSDHNRSYIMYIADQTFPPSFGTAGLPDYSTYPTGGSALTDVRDVLNWEASGHNTNNWSTYFYARVSSSGLTASTLHTDIYDDISQGYPVVAEVITKDLPNWPSGSNAIHYITVIGYSDPSGVYYYTDTCSKGCGSLNDGGINTIAQSQLLTAITDYNSYPGANLTYNGGFDW